MRSPRSASDDSRMVCSISARLAYSASKVPVRGADRAVLGPGSPAGLAGGRTDRGRAGSIPTAPKRPLQGVDLSQGCVTKLGPAFGNGLISGGKTTLARPG
jgi:hypothetical protein